jgi:hypothetical protein
MRKFLRWGAATALASVAVLPVACGSVVAVPTDAGPPDASFDPDGGADADAVDGDGFSAPDAPQGRDAAYDAPSWPTDAACDDGGLAGDGGATFSCMGTPCAVDSQYCGRFSGGRIVPFFSPEMGCHPLPCACAPARGCDCLQPLPTFCSCATDNGAITVTCMMP